MTKQWKPLTDPQGAAILPFFNLKRKRKYELPHRRTGLIVDIILWLLHTGCQWRNLSPDWPHWQLVYYYFDQWKGDGTFEQINAMLNQMDRQRARREACPFVLYIDSQNIKLHPLIWQDRGFDRHKCINGRKRPLIVDTQGRIWLVGVHAAQQDDGPAAMASVGDLLWRIGERLEKVYGDQVTMAFLLGHYPNGVSILSGPHVPKRLRVLFL
ncbi:transposase [uncultured Fibrella sp.]|uniref:transposase n=1 Tax=uncultured Fibrella sp. TaxID=1284596 RepID=UPI0035CB4373